MEIRDQLHACPRNIDLASAEKEAMMEYRKAHEAYMSFLRQKAKERWISSGDDNTKLFYQSIKARRVENKIYAIQDGNGDWVIRDDRDEKVKIAFVDFYKGLLGTKMQNRCSVKTQVINEGMTLTDEQQNLLTCNFSAEDVKQVMLSIPNENPLGWMDTIATFISKVGISLEQMLRRLFWISSGLVSY